MNLHGTAIAIEGEGVLLLGASGVGKTDLALRLIDQGARLIADDRVILCAQNGQLIAQSPENIRHIIELNGIGLIRVDALTSAPLTLAITCVPGQPERLPAPQAFAALGLQIPQITLNPLHASTPAKLALYLQARKKGDALNCDWFATPAIEQHLSS